MPIFGGKIAPALLVPPAGTDPQDSQIIAPANQIITPYAPTVDNVGGFPSDTLIYIKFAQQYYTTWVPDPDPNVQFMQGLTITPPPGFDNNGADRDHIWVWVSGKSPWQDNVFEPIRQANPTWAFIDFPAVVGNATNSALFHKRAVPPPDDADNNFVVPDASNVNYKWAISYVVTGQNANAFSQRYIGALPFTSGFNTAWPLNGGTFGTDFNCLEHLFLYRRLVTDATQGNPVQPFLGPLALDSIDQSGGWLQAISETDQVVQLIRDQPFPPSGPIFDTFWQVNQWVAWYIRFLVTSPDANSGLARTITYEEVPITNSTGYFGVYFRTELGF